MILVAGSANLDFVVRAGHIPAPGETVLGHGFQTFPGGKGANQAVACARAGGVPTAMLLALGNDAFAAPLLDSLRSAGVELHIQRTPDQPTGTAFICVSEDGENAITVAPGANLCLVAEHLPSLAGVSHLLMQLETPVPTVFAYARAARAQGVQVVLNAAPAQALPAQVLALVDILIVNEGELAALSLPLGAQAGDIDKQLACIAVPCVVVTLGGKGCMARVLPSAGAGLGASGAVQTFNQAAFPVQVVDSTGAGDTFCGALVAALSQHHQLQTALRRASAAAALSCTQLGAQSAIPTRKAVDTLLSTP